MNIVMTGREFDEACENHWQSGYRAAMEAVRKEMDRLNDIIDADRGHEDDWYDLKKWLDEQLKQEGT